LKNYGALINGLGKFGKSGYLKYFFGVKMKESQNIVNKDLEYIADRLKTEFTILSGKKLLITGGAGFLGYYLIQSVLYSNKINNHREPIGLIVLDNFIRGLPQWLVELKEDKDLKLIEHDITEPLPKDIEIFDYIMHAASIASPTYYRKHPIETMDANVNGLRNLLEYTKERKERNTPVQGFVFFSSSETYGNPSLDCIPTPETYYGYVSFTGPRACYDESKRYGETLCVNFVRQYGLPIKIVRPFNNYGPGLKITDKRVIPDFARDVLAGRDIIMFSDGAPTRTFCYIADAIIGYYKVLIKGEAGEAYNIGVQEPEISMADLAEKIVDISTELFDYNGRVVHRSNLDQDYLKDNPDRRCPQIEKARSVLEYHPSISLDEGLRRSLIWYHDHLSAEES
jgi:dTDP-glucose 4,6-dehydratase/UDP-glucuronate decarboxylase